MDDEIITMEVKSGTDAKSVHEAMSDFIKIIPKEYTKNKEIEIQYQERSFEIDGNTMYAIVKPATIQLKFVTK